VEYARTVLQRDLDLRHGVQVRWFDVAGFHDWPGDSGVFVSDRPLRGCVDPAAPTEARLNVALTRRPAGELLRTLTHEGLHVEELRRGRDRRRSHEALERPAEEVVTLLCVGIPG
jgi:hypothetical protein